MLQSLRPADASLRRPVPLTRRSIAIPTLVALTTVAVAAAASHVGV